MNAFDDSPQKELYTRDETARILGVSSQTLTNWACTRLHDLPFVKMRSKLVRYRRTDIDQFIERHMVRATAVEV